jgi:hypothetical protein
MDRVWLDGVNEPHLTTRSFATLARVQFVRTAAIESGSVALRVWHSLIGSPRQFGTVNMTIERRIQAMAAFITNP